MQKFINNWSTTITQALSPSDTVIHIDIESANRLAVGFQQGDYYLLTLDDGVNIEIIRVVSINDDRLLVEREQENITAKSWRERNKIEARVTANTLSKLSNVLDDALTNGLNVLLSEGNIICK